jgi:hypothetical protein
VQVDLRGHADLHRAGEPAGLVVVRPPRLRHGVMSAIGNRISNGAVSTSSSAESATSS